MNKYLRAIDEKAGTVQITTVNERWYSCHGGVYYPSVSWILQYFPKDKHFIEWVGKLGNDGAKDARDEAAGRGSRVHHGIERLISGETLRMDTPLGDGNGNEREPEPFEWERLMGFAHWVADVNPTFIHNERTIISDKHGFGGTLDAVVDIDGERFIVDFKTSKSLHKEHELQLSAYRVACVEEGIIDESAKVAILHLGGFTPRSRPRGYAWKEIKNTDEAFRLFLSVRSIWEAQNEEKCPKERDYPLSISIK